MSLSYAGTAASPLLPPKTCHRALRIPEIVAIILEQLALEGAPALFRAAQVCRLWVDKSLSLLWFRPTPKALRCIDGDERRRFYARWIGAVHADDFESSVAEFFPWVPYLRLQELAIPADALMLDHLILTRLFQPRLVWLRCSTSAFVTELMFELVGCS